jgi:formylmethanofuran dehydrogenase subunit C
MKEMRLTPKITPDLPVEAETITPNIFAGKESSKIMALRVQEGNRIHRLDDFFDVEGESAEKAESQLIVIDGDVPWLKHVGAQMTGGRIMVEGDLGMHIGSQMSGGEIIVNGSVSDWAGAEMRGGLIRIRGDAGDLLGSAYRGSSEGMTGGCIIVEGNAGVEIGSFMRRGMIIVLGGVGSFAGVHMNGGEIFIFGPAGKRLGAEMRGNGGFIACLGKVDELLPTFVHDTTYSPTFINLYLRELRDDLRVKDAGKYLFARFRRYRGDTAVGGNGEILIFKD